MEQRVARFCVVAQCLGNWQRFLKRGHGEIEMTEALLSVPAAAERFSQPRAVAKLFRELLPELKEVKRRAALAALAELVGSSHQGGAQLPGDCLRLRRKPDPPLLVTLQGQERAQNGFHGVGGRLGTCRRWLLGGLSEDRARRTEEKNDDRQPTTSGVAHGRTPPF
jgi:hypothetical protein